MVCVYVRIWDTDLDIPQRWAGRGGEPAEGELITDEQTRQDRREGFSRVSTTAAAASMGGDTTRQLKGEGIGGGGTDANICPRGLDFAAVRSGGGRSRKGRARCVEVGKARSSGMMSLALHTRLHWERLRKNAAFPRFRALPAAPLFGGRGASLGRFLCPAANGRAPRMDSSGPLGFSWGKHVARALPTRPAVPPGSLCPDCQIRRGPQPSRSFTL